MGCRLICHGCVLYILCAAGVQYMPIISHPGYEYERMPTAHPTSPKLIAGPFMGYDYAQGLLVFTREMR